MIEVYYAEDDEIIAKSVKEYLEQQNCKVTVFGAIVDIKKALINHLPSVILLDWNMPGGQGNEEQRRFWHIAPGQQREQLQQAIHRRGQVAGQRGLCGLYLPAGLLWF